MFLIYAAATAGFTSESRIATKALAVLVAIGAMEAWFLERGAWFWILVTVLPVVIGVLCFDSARRHETNRRLRAAQRELEELARIAERERIARDLHDVLGHSLSVVILKSELASKLIGRDSARAEGEIRDVERISRQALTEVRSAINGYRAIGLEHELAEAAATLNTAGSAAECEAAHVALSPAQETVLALAIREAVTNVVRHAHAKRCRLQVEIVDGQCVVQIYDDGRGGWQAEGNGLRGIRERVEAMRGTVRRETSAGTRLTISLPVPSLEEGKCA
ncbi:MAG: sensor histidine kinase [Bryobacteraceae bacterium]